MSAKSITFSGFSLQDSNFVTKDIIYRNMPSKIIDVEPKSRRNGFFVRDVHYENKEIIVRGTLTRDTEANLKTSLDLMKQSLLDDESALDIDDGGTTMRFTASVQSINVPEKFYNITQIPFEIVFLAQPFCTETSTTNHSDDNITSSPHNSSLTMSGSANPSPVITITVDAETSMSVIKFENVTTGSEMTITRAFSAAEILEIDCDNLTVKVDGTEVDFTGVFPEFDPSSNSYKITITDGGAFNIDLDIDYYPTYT